MPETIDNLVYVAMSGLIVVGIAAIGWLLNKGFDAVKDRLDSINDSIKIEHDGRLELKAELRAMQRVCDERHGIPQRRATDLSNA